MAKRKKQSRERWILERTLTGLVIFFIGLLGTAFMLSNYEANRLPDTTFLDRFKNTITLKAAKDPLKLIVAEKIGSYQTNYRGEKGEKGYQGERGPKGEKGDQGPAGQAGSNGQNGVKGDNGATGATGATGPAGSSNASDLSSGTLADARLSTNVTLQGNTFNGSSQLVQLTAGGLLPALSAGNLTSINASSISSGTLSDARLSANVALLNGTGPQTFSGNNKFTGSLTLGSAGTALSQVRLYTSTIDPSMISAVTTSEQTFTVSGLSTSDVVIVNKSSHTSGCGIVNARVSATDTLAITFMNVLPALTCNPPSETYSIIAIR